MDLMKLLKAKTEHLLTKSPQNEYSYCEKIISDLKVQFDAFLKDVAKLDEFKREILLRESKLSLVKSSLKTNLVCLEKAPTFLRIPGHPGLLLEPSVDQTLVLLQATEARPFQRQWNGEMSSQVVFVRKPSPMAVYKVLEEDVVRNTTSPKTYFGTQFFEHLVETLIIHLNEKSA